MILVTGAAGKSGRAVIQALAVRGSAVRALIHHQNQTQAVLSAGATEITVGDMADPTIYQQAMTGISAVYFICPNVNPDELEFVQDAIAAAQTTTRGLLRLMC